MFVYDCLLHSSAIFGQDVVQAASSHESLGGPSTLPIPSLPFPLTLDKRTKDKFGQGDSKPIQQPQDGEAIFGDHVASRLRQFTARQKAIAYIEIDRLLLKIQYPNDPYFNPRQPPNTTNSPTAPSQNGPAPAAQPSGLPADPNSSPQPNFEY